MTDFALFQTVPGSSTVGTPIGTPPPNVIGVALYLPSGASITYAVASAQPVAAPSPTFTVDTETTAGPWIEHLLPGQNLYVTAEAGSPLFRWIMGG